MLTVNEQHQHNLRLPVSRVPNEILSQIFFDLRDTFISRTRNGHGLKCLVGWISVTRVCHVWREIALNTPLLWSHIDVLPSFGPWIPELLRRSKHSPIALFVPFQFAPIDEKHFGRVRELVLDCQLELTLHTIFSSPSNFPNLEKLDIFQPDKFGRNPPKDRFVLADANLGTQRLRTLNLRASLINWNSKFLQGLTHLRLERTPIQCALGAFDFALVLSKIPALETLYLYYSLRDMEQVKDVKAVKVHLQHLRKLFVKCSGPSMARFLLCLVIPRSCKMDIFTGSHYEETCDEFRDILSWVSNQLSVPTTRPLACSGASDHVQYIRTLHFIYDPNTSEFSVEGFCDVLSHQQVVTAEPILRFSMWTYQGGDTNFLRFFFPSLPLEGVVVINAVAKFGTFLASECWTVAFGSIETLTTVYLNTKTLGFWEALTPADSNDGTKFLPFPALFSVTVKDCLLDFQLVVNILGLRSRLGVTPLQDLHLICDGEQPPAAIINQLGGLVRRIHIVASDSDADGGSDEDNEVIIRQNRDDEAASDM